MFIKTLCSPSLRGESLEFHTKRRLLVGSGPTSPTGSCQHLFCWLLSAPLLLEHAPPLLQTRGSSPPKLVSSWLLLHGCSLAGSSLGCSLAGSSLGWSLAACLRKTDLHLSARSSSLPTGFATALAPGSADLLGTLVGFCSSFLLLPLSMASVLCAGSHF